jgi:hypothetical protein
VWAEPFLYTNTVLSHVNLKQETLLATFFIVF